MVISTITFSAGAETFIKTDTKLYVPVVTVSIQDNIKLLEQLKSEFKRTINWNKYQSKVSIERKTIFRLLNPFNFLESKQAFDITSFENNTDGTAYTIQDIIFQK